MILILGIAIAYTCLWWLSVVGNQMIWTGSWIRSLAHIVRCGLVHGFVLSHTLCAVDLRWSRNKKGLLRPDGRHNLTMLA